MSFTKNLARGLFNGYIDDDIKASEHFKPRLIVNDVERGEKVLTSISDELKKCDSFLFSVAFVTNGGISALINTFKWLEDNNIKGTIIASQYQNFSQPIALRRLLAFKNIELRIVPDKQFHMHAKAYIFRKGEEYSLIVGSSNLTNDALCVNQEWNIKVTSTAEGSIIKQALIEFDYFRKISTLVDEAWLTSYEKVYAYEKRKKLAVEAIQDLEEIELHTIMPNTMQSVALNRLQLTRDHGNTRALVISATGTGKTYLSAFDVKAFKPKRFLFIVHRELIASDALKSYKEVLGKHIKMGVLGGKHKSVDADYVFSTIQSISRDDVLSNFAKDAFDYIVIDEVHRAGAASYQKILNYFEPKFLLGMSATPDRTDGYDVYSLFNHNIAYEIRLNEAMKENMVCPFHYYGISDITVDGVMIDEKTDFRYLDADERVNNIIQKASFYGYSGERVKGLVFCSRNSEASALSKKFNEKGFRTVSLSGPDSFEAREDAIRRLEQSEDENALDYIFTVDIFNEGVDIPAINQVIMLRPTQSAIIFVQQLGRGLRHDQEKEYVVVLDFIGNYEKNFFIPMALSGDKSYNKDNLRRFVIEGNRVIPGCSTVNFDEITKKKIFAAIDSANFNEIGTIKESYKALKNMLGRVPTLFDFDQYGSIDPMRFSENNSLGSYHKFLTKYEPEYDLSFDEIKEEIIDYISRKFVNGKRPHELLLFRALLDGDTDVFSRLEKLLYETYQIELNDLTKESLINIMTNNFAAGAAKNTYKHSIFIEISNTAKPFDYRISAQFEVYLDDEAFRGIIEQMVHYGLKRYEAHYAARYKDTDFQLYQKYTYEDVCRLLSWEKNEVPLNIGGYKFDKRTKTFPVFINYHKDDTVSATIRYEDRFVSPKEIIAISKSGRTKSSDDVVTIYNAKQLGVHMHLFVRKNKDDKISKEFYYLGMIEAVGQPKPVTMDGTDKGAVEIIYRLDTAVRRDVFDYFMVE